jgi:Flp pilus assembly protein TadD
MDRSLARLAAVLLLGASFAGCSSMSSDSTATSKSSPSHDQQASAKSFASDVDTQLHSAQALRAAGDYQGATKIVSQLMLVTPDDPRVVGEYGKTLVQQGRSKEALDFLKRAVELAPGDWTLYSATGIAYDQNGDYASARIAYMQALAMKPGDAGVLNNYALSRMQAGDLSGAHQLLAQAQATGSADPKIARNVALLTTLSPVQEAAQAPAAKPQPAAPQTQPKTTVARAIAPSAPTAHSSAPRPVQTVMMQQIPIDPKAGPVATQAPRKLVKDAPPSHVAAAVTHPAAVVAPKAPVTKKVATAVPAAPKKTADAKASAKTKTPALRMTADAATP